MDITTIIVCVIAAAGFLIGRFIRKLGKEEIKPGKTMLKLAQDLLFGIVLVFLLITFNLGWILSILLAAAYTTYVYLKKKEPKKISLIVLAATIAITFRTEFFLYTSGIAFLYTLTRGIKTKEWKNALKNALFLLIFSLILIYLRIL